MEPYQPARYAEGSGERAARFATASELARRCISLGMPRPGSQRQALVAPPQEQRANWEASTLQAQQEERRRSPAACSSGEPPHSTAAALLPPPPAPATWQQLPALPQVQPVQRQRRPLTPRPAPPPPATFHPATRLRPEWDDRTAGGTAAPVVPPETLAVRAALLLEQQLAKYERKVAARRRRATVTRPKVQQISSDSFRQEQVPAAHEQPQPQAQPRRKLSELELDAVCEAACLELLAQEFISA